MTRHFWWPTDYFASRNKFLDTAEAAGAQILSHPIVPTGPGNEPLSVDVATLISDNDEHRIILISGVHGVEGFVGAVVQIEALNRLKQSARPAGAGIVLIHAANPWGFAHLRRVDERNVDLNRNFLDFKKIKPASHSGYAALDPIINPQTAPTMSGELRYWSNASRLIVKHRGLKKLAEPIAQGQYDFPKGIFYGGSENSPSAVLLGKLISRYSGTSDRVSILDVHTGLGPSATATLIANSNRKLSQPTSDWLQTYYKKPVVMDNAPGNAYSASGSLSQWCGKTFATQQYLYLCIEIGTVNPIALFSALRRENQAHHWAGENVSSYSKTKTALSNVFAPQSDQWRRKAVTQGLQVLDQTLCL